METTTKKQTKTERILKMLQIAGERGVGNYEFMHVAYQYPVCIHALRHKFGYNIEKEHIEGTEWRFYLRTSKAVQEELF